MRPHIARTSASSPARRPNTPQIPHTPVLADGHLGGRLPLPGQLAKPVPQASILRFVGPDELAMTLDGYRQPACKQACDDGHNEHGQRTLWPDAAARDLGFVDLSQDGSVVHFLDACGFVFAPQREVELLLYRYLPSEALLFKAKLRR